MCFIKQELYFPTSQLTPLASESLMEGVHCTVKHEGKIYRAILDDVSDTENVRAVLPDYGFTISTSVANVSNFVNIIIHVFISQKHFYR